MWLVLVGMIVQGLAMAVATFAGRALLALFIGYVSYAGLTATTDFIFSNMQSNLSALPTDIANLLGYLWIDKAVSTLASAHAAAMVVKLATGSTITKTYIKK